MVLWLPESVNGALLGDKAPELWCSEQVDGIKANLETYYGYGVTYASKGAVYLGTTVGGFFASVTSSLTSIPLSLFIYTTFLFTFLKYEDKLEAEIAALAPLDPGETNQVVASLYEKVWKTIGLTLIEAVFAFAATLLAFSLGDFRIKWVFAFAAGFLELIPFGTPW
jgi:predicted PurR-regulated permease PerM